MFLRVQRNGERAYLLVVENQRVNGRLKQRVLHHLRGWISFSSPGPGRFDHVDEPVQSDFGG